MSREVRGGGVQTQKTLRGGSIEIFWNNTLLKEVISKTRMWQLYAVLITDTRFSELNQTENVRLDYTKLLYTAQNMGP